MNAVDPKDYKLLPGQALGLNFSLLGRRVRGYLGPDHLLAVEGTGYTERLRPLYYADIQALQVWDRKGQGLALAGFGGSGLLLGLSAGLSALDHSFLPLAFLLGPLALLCLTAFGWSLYSGPLCSARVMVDGVWSELGVWRTWRAARAGLPLLLPRLAAAQPQPEAGEPAGEAVRGSASAPAAAGSREADAEARARAAAADAATPAPARDQRWARGVIEAAVLAFLVSAAANAAPFLGWQQPELMVLASMLPWALSAVALVLTVRSAREALPHCLGALGLVLVTVLLSVAEAFVLIADGHPPRPGDIASVDAVALAQNPVGGALLAVECAVLCLAALVLALGLRRLRKAAA